MYPFVILNLEDPGWTEKAWLAVQAGAKLMSYSWVYHGHGRESLLRAYAAEELIRNIPGAVFVHHWLDYEDGVTPDDLDQAKTVLRVGTPVGTYGYLAMIQQQGADFWDSKIGPLWIAYYPAGYETVAYQDHFSNTARRYGAVMHQWTSVWGADGHGDMNVVLDEPWYNALGGATAPPSNEHEEVDMLYHELSEDKWYRDAAGYLVPLGTLTGKWYGLVVSGKVPVVELDSVWDVIAFNAATMKAEDDIAAIRAAKAAK